MHAPSIIFSTFVLRTMFPVLNFVLPAHEINRMRRQPSPTVAWHALGDESAFPFALIIVLLLALLAVQLAHYATLSFFSSIRIPAWCKDPLGLRRQAARIAHMHERHRATTEKFAKVVYRFRGLQVQVKVRPPSPSETCGTANRDTSPTGARRAAAAPGPRDGRDGGDP